MNRESEQVTAARKLAANAVSMLGQSQAFQRLDPSAQTALIRDLETIQRALTPAKADPYALTLETPNDRRRGRPGSRQSEPADGQTSAPQSPDGNVPALRVAATETLARRAGALSDEIDFPAFVAGLVHGTFDAIVDASIRQMETFADLVSSVAKDVDQFTRDNVTPNQVRDWLVHQYPNDLALDFPSGQPRLRRRTPAGETEDETPPAWLVDYGLDGPLTEELIEEQLIPAAQRKVGENRLQMLATMVLLGMNRINVKDGTISAKLRFRAAAKDKADVNYAVSQDTGGGGWGGRGSLSAPQHSTMVSTVGVNVQAETELKAELFGEVKINFVSETLPLERFADSAMMTLLQRNARASSSQPAPTAVVPAPMTAAPSVTPAVPPVAPAAGERK